MGGIQLTTPERKKAFVAFLKNALESARKAAKLDHKPDPWKNLPENVQKRFLIGEGEKLPNTIREDTWKELVDALDIDEKAWEDFYLSYKEADSASDNGIVKLFAQNAVNPGFEQPIEADNAFLDKIKQAIIKDLAEFDNVLQVLAAQFNLAQETSTLSLSKQLTTYFIQACRGGEDDLRKLIDKLRTGFKGLKKNHANDELQVTNLRNLADRLLYKLLLFTVDDAWVNKNQLKKCHSWPYLDSRTQKVVHSRLNKYLPKATSKVNQGLSKDSGIQKHARIADFLLKLNKILNPDNYEFMPQGSNSTEKEREAHNIRKAEELDKQLAFRGKTDDLEFRESIYWQINDVSPVDEEVIDWVYGNIKHLHWIILKADQDEQILWFNNNALAAAINEFYLIW